MTVSAEPGPTKAVHARALSALAFAGSFVVCALAVGALAITLLGRSGEPTVTLDLANPSPIKAPAPPVRHGEIALPPAGVPITRPVYAGTALLADPALIENTAQGPMPRIADDGRKPMTAYAAPAAAGKLKIAIVMSGLGLSARATQGALDGLPAAITLGFLPYAGDVGHWVALARARGHEVVLQVPMEPFDFPESDPGPHTLRAGQDEDANRQRLAWAMTRFTGYAGVTNLLASASCPTPMRWRPRSLSWPGAGFISMTTMPRRNRWRRPWGRRPAWPSRGAARCWTPSARPWKSTASFPPWKPRRGRKAARSARRISIPSRWRALLRGRRDLNRGGLFWCPSPP